MAPTQFIISEILTAVTAGSEINTKEVLLLILLNLGRIHQEIMMCFYNTVSSFGRTRCGAAVPVIYSELMAGDYQPLQDSIVTFIETTQELSP